MRFLPALVILAFAFGSHSLAAEKILWGNSYETALAQAKKQGKLVVAHFWLAGRPLHKAMDEETFSNSEVAKFSSQRFVNVRIDIAARPELFEKAIGGRGGLGTCVLDWTGDVVSAHPGYAEASTYLEFLKRADRGYPKLKAARSAFARSPESPAILHSLAETYQALGSPRRAEEHFEKMTRLIPQSNTKYVSIGHERIARFRALRGRNREASGHVAEYRKLDPENRYGRLDRVLLTEALVAWIERRFRDSIRILEEALARFPMSAERDQMLLALGTVRHEGGEDQRALEILTRLIKEHPTSRSILLAKEQINHIKNPPLDHEH